MTDLPFDWNDPNVTVRPALGSTRTCRRHQYDWSIVPDAEPDSGGHLPVDLRCSRCGRWYNPELSRRGRTNRARGNAIEREVAKKLGLRRTGQYGGKDDLSGDLVKAQVKSGGAFSERYWAWLKSVPVDAAQTPILVVTDAPGPGHRRRAVVVMDLDDWADWYGGK